MSASNIVTLRSGQVPRDARTVTILIVARLLAPAGEGLCRIRNIAPGGMMLESATPLGVGEIVCAELRNGQRLEGRVAWSRDGRAGIAFVESIDIRDVVAQAPALGSRLRRARQPRGPRITLDLAIAVELANGPVFGRLLDISQGGARLTLPRPVTLGERMTLELPGLRRKRAFVRWVGPELGVAFAEPLGFDELSRWLARPRAVSP